MANAPFPVQPELTAVSIAYGNRAYVADAVLPRVPVGKQDFKYTLWNLAEGFTIPDTRVGRKGTPNEVEFSGTEATGSCQGYGLDDPVPYDDIDNASGVYDPVSRAVERTTDLILLDREVRVAGTVFNTASYGASNRATLSGASQWSDPNSNPVDAVLAAIDSMVMRPNVLVLGRSVYSKLIQHPKVVAAAFPGGGNASVAGKVNRQALIELFELEDLVVGESFFNTAKRGQAAALSRVWGKHAALICRNAQADTQGGTTFGFTAQWGERLAGSAPDTKIGLRGGERVRVGEYVKEVVTAQDLGYFFQNAIA